MSTVENATVAAPPKPRQAAEAPKQAETPRAAATPRPAGDTWTRSGQSAGSSRLGLPMGNVKVTGNKQPTSPAPAPKPEAWDRLRRVDPAKVKQFRDDMQAKARELGRRLAADPKVQEAKAKWATMTADERLELGRHIAKIQGEVFGFKPSNMTFKGDKAMEGSDGTYNDANGNIEINKDKVKPGNEKNDSLAGMKNFVDTIVHEQFHRFQHVLRTTSFPTDDPRHHGAAMYRSNEDNYVSAPDDPEKSPITYQRYRNQPVEKDAWDWADAVASRVFGAEGGAHGPRTCNCKMHAGRSSGRSAA